MAKRHFMWLAAALLIFGLIVGPWPADDTPYRNTDYAKNTYRHIEQRIVNVTSGEIYSGVASFDISPPPGIPLGGYSARDPKANTGILLPPKVKALSFSDGNQTVTIVTADILIPLNDYITSTVRKTEIPRESLYFVPTHTHSGPGGYAQGLVEEMNLGEFDKSYFNFLVERTSQAITQSRSHLEPAELEYNRFRLTQEQVKHFVYDQLNRGPDGYPILHLLRVKNAETATPISSLITFSAHPTFLGRKNRQVHGDYPGALTEKLEREWQHPVLFAIGAVGGSLPMAQGSPPKETVEQQLKQIELMSHDLGDLITRSLDRGNKRSRRAVENGAPIDLQWRTTQAEIGALLIRVNLPSASYRISDNWRLSPFVLNTLFHDNQTFVHAIRIGRLVFLGYPADFSGELAQAIETWASNKAIYPWVTSFNGDYIGYLVPSNRYDMDHYTTRDGNLFGRWGGDYLVDVGKRMTERLMHNPIE